MSIKTHSLVLFLCGVVFEFLSCKENEKAELCFSDTYYDCTLFKRGMEQDKGSSLESEYTS